MAYEKLTKKTFLEKLANDEYAEATGARRAVGKATEMTEDEKKTCKAAIDKKFGDSSAVKKPVAKKAAKVAKAAPKAAKVAKKAAKVAKASAAVVETPAKKSAIPKGRPNRSVVGVCVESDGYYRGTRIFESANLCQR